jgi:hypothetical protein
MPNPAPVSAVGPVHAGAGALQLPPLHVWDAPQAAQAALP